MSNLRRLLILFIIALCAPRAQAAPAPAPPENLPAAIERQAADLQTIQSKADEAAAALRKWYETALDAVKKDAQAQGNLDGVVAVDAERQRMERDLTAEEKSQLPPLSQTVRSQYDKARVKQAGQLSASVGAALVGYLATLEDLEKRLTKKGEIEAALAVRREHAAAQERLSAQPAPAATPAPLVAPARATPTPASRNISLMADSTAGMPALRLASELKAWATLQSPHQDAIGFNTPGGPSNSEGGRGVLYKKESNSSHKGSTWSFAWTFSGAPFNGASGIRMVHPFEGGHVIVRLTASGLQPCRAAFWVGDPMNTGGDPKFFKDTADTAKVFPLKMNQKYAVRGQLDPKGGYTVWIDGKVVGTGSYKDSSSSPYIFPKPISLPKGFSGENLPMVWKPGYAALMVGPTKEESAGNLCQEVTYQAAATEK